MHNLEQHFQENAGVTFASADTQEVVGVVSECFGKRKSIHSTFGDDTSLHLLEV